MPSGFRFRVLQFPNKNLLTAGSLYLCYYFALGAFLPYINLYFQKMGMSGIQIGVLAALPVLVGSFASLFIGGLTDRFHWHIPALRLALILCPISVYFLARTKTFSLLIPVIIAYAIFNSPIVPLLDSSAVEIASEDSKSYGALRVWGSIGWAISTVVVGWLIQRSGFTWLFAATIVFLVLTFITSFSQPPRKNVLHTSYLTGLQDLFQQKKFLWYLASIFLVMIASAAVMAFFSIYMASVGAGEGLIGWAWALAALSEMPFMALSGKLIRRLGSKGLLILSFSVYAVRWLLVSFIHSPGLLLITQLMHGGSFALMLTGSVNYINEHTPAGLNTTALAIFNTVAYGFGSMTGSLLGGFIDQNWPLTILFQICSSLVTAGLLIFILSQRVERAKVLV